MPATRKARTTEAPKTKRVWLPVAYRRRDYAMSALLGFGIPSVLVGLALWATPETVTQSLWVTGAVTALGALLLTGLIAMVEGRGRGGSLPLQVGVLALAVVPGVLMFLVTVVSGALTASDPLDIGDDFVYLAMGPLTGYLYIPAVTAGALLVNFIRAESPVTLPIDEAVAIERLANARRGKTYAALVTALICGAAFTTVNAVTVFTTAFDETEETSVSVQQDLLKNEGEWYQLTAGFGGAYVSFFTTDEDGAPVHHELVDARVTFDSSVTEQVATFTTTESSITTTVNGVEYVMDHREETTVTLPGAAE